MTNAERIAALEAKVADLEKRLNNQNQRITVIDYRPNLLGQKVKAG